MSAPRIACRVAALAAVAFMFGAAAAQEQPLVISCEDLAFARDSSHARLVERFGAPNVTVKEEPGPRGMAAHVTSVVYAKDRKRRLEVIWHDGGKRERPFAFVFEKPSQWVAPRGVRVGLGLAELERADGGRFTFYGFGDMIDGMTLFKGALARLPGGCSVDATLAPTVRLPKRERDRIEVDDEFRSDHPLMRKAKPVAVSVQVVYQAQ